MSHSDARDDLQRELSDLRAAVDKFAIFTTTDAEGRIIEANDQFCKVSGYTEGELKYQNHRMINSGLHSKETYNKLWNTIQDGRVWSGILRNQAKDGTYFWAHSTIVPFLDKSGKPLKYMAFRVNLTDEVNLRNELHHYVNHDYATGLPNRRRIEQVLAEFIDTQKSGVPRFWTVLIGIDNLKSINEVLGYDSGESVLRKVIKEIQEFTLESDVVGLVNPDELVVIGSRYENATKFNKMVTAVLNRFERPIEVNQKYSVYIELSAGISAFPKDATTPVTLLKRAALALHSARDDYPVHGTANFYTPSIDERAEKSLSLLADLAFAAEREQFCLHYQPKFNLSTNRITGAEALIRWHHPRYGTIMPKDFISLAAAHGMLPLISNWVLSEVCNHLREWNLKDNTSVSVNVSAQDLMQVDIVERILGVLRQCSVSPQQIILEITEVEMAGGRLISSVLNDLRAAGIRISMDDFGTGFSSISCLRDLKIDELKVDKSFLDGVETDDRARSILEFVSQLTHKLGLNMVVEGVETLSQYVLLKSLGCREIQGYFIGHPVQPDEFQRMLEKQRPDMDSAYRQTPIVTAK